MRIIGHFDMDAFFAAVEEREKPRLRGKPIVVGADPREGKGRGVVSTANYRAREYGIHSAMPISVAWRLSEKARREGKPPVAFVLPDFRPYRETSERIMQIIGSHANMVEQASVDEMYLDLSFADSYEKAKAICEAIKEEIKKKEHLTASVGVGPNKLIAKIASDRQKPDGFTVVREEDAEKFVATLSMRVIPGIGPKTEKKFNDLGAKTVGDLKRFKKSELHELLGKWGDILYGLVRAEDDRPVAPDKEVKSIGEQETFQKDSRNPSFLGERLKELARGVFARFKKSDYKTFRRIVLTVRFSDFETKQRSRSLKLPSRDTKTFEFEAMKLLMPFFDKRENPKRKPIRLVGVRMEELSQ